MVRAKLWPGVTVMGILVMLLGACTPTLESSEAPNSVIQETKGLVLSDALISGCDRTGMPGGFENAGLAVGETAVDFTLQDVHGKTVSLAGLLTDKPVVMVFGSFT